MARRKNRKNERRFGIFILTHGRPDNVKTYRAVRRCGYTGPVWLVVDDQDKTLPEYEAAFPGEVLVFSKDDIAARFDQGSNFDERRSIFYARNACFDLAEGLGLTHFMQLDDDYHGFYHRFDADHFLGCWPVRRVDMVLDAMCDFLDRTPALTVALAQGGDYVGGNASKRLASIGAHRKAMNTFVCRTDRRFPFLGRVNEDVSTYVEVGRRGGLLLTFMGVQIVQPATQKNAGGMTELYVDSGTYVKSFYSVLYSPSCVRVGMMSTKHSRIHHKVKWRNAVPKILREAHRREREA